MKDCVSRLFMVRMKLGEFDPPDMNPYKKLAMIYDQRMQLIFLTTYNNMYRLNASDYVQSKEHIQLAYDMAVQSIVLLKNDHSNGLPITSPKKKACVSPLNSTIIMFAYMIIFSLQVIGPFIDDPSLLFGDYSPTLMVTRMIWDIDIILKFLFGRLIIL